MISKKPLLFSSKAIIFVSLLLLASCARNICPPSEIILVLESAKDAWICNRPEYVDRNFGDHVEILAEGWTADGTPLIVRGLIEFDLSAIPKNVNVTEAKLHLQSVGNTVNGPGHSKLSGSNEASLKWVQEKWGDNSVTWNTQPAITEDKQVTLPASERDLQNYEIDVTEMVTAMLEDPEKSHGFMLMVKNETHYRRMLFASSDYDDPAKWPRLIIKARLNE